MKFFWLLKHLKPYNEPNSSSCRALRGPSNSNSDSNGNSMDKSLNQKSVISVSILLSVLPFACHCYRWRGLWHLCTDRRGLKGTCPWVPLPQRACLRPQRSPACCCGLERDCSWKQHAPASVHPHRTGRIIQWHRWWLLYDEKRRRGRGILDIHDDVQWGLTLDRGNHFLLYVRMLKLAKIFSSATQSNRQTSLIQLHQPVIWVALTMRARFAIGSSSSDAAELPVERNRQ